MRPSRATTITRWVGATIAFLVVAWIDVRFGHMPALLTLIALLVIVAIWGGSGHYHPPSGAEKSSQESVDEESPH